jgi:acetolactate synthase I/II/III large subunit
MKVSDAIAARLVGLRVRHVFGVGGANIEDMFAAVQRRRPEIRMVLGKHEHAAGTAADAYARLTGGLGVTFVTSGGGAMNLVHSVAEARASGVPLLAIVGEPPTDLQGVGAFQDTSGRRDAIDAAAAFGAVSVWCKRVEGIEQIPRLLSEAIDAALGTQPGPAVLLLAKDFQRAELELECLPAYTPPDPVLPDAVAVQQAAALLRAGPTLIIAGDEVARAGAEQELAAIANALDARVAVAPEARDAFDNHAACFVGIAGAMGCLSVERALSRARACLVVGTRLPVLARQGLEELLAQRPIISLGRKRPFISSIGGLHVEGDLLRALRALRVELGASLALPSRAPAEPPVRETFASSEHDTLTARSALRTIEDAMTEGSIVLVDAGNTGAAAVHELRLPRGARWLQAMGMAGMGYSFGAAVGAACATGRRCFALAGDGAFFMNGLDIHTAVEHELPITYVIFDNRAHGMCLVRERLLLGENAGYNAFRQSHLGAGLGAMFPGFAACDCRTTAALTQALERAAQRRGPSLISIELDHVEIPPFAAFQRPADGISTVSRGGPDEDH